MFGTPERFLAMVRAGYPAVYRAAGVIVRGNHIRNTAFSAIRGNAAAA